MARSTSVVLIFLQAARAACAFGIVEPHLPKKARGPLKIRRGATALPFNNLGEVLTTVRESLPRGFGPNSTILNVGASWKAADPIYELKLNKTHPDGYNLVGYECDSERVGLIKKNRRDVNIRNMCVTGPTIVGDMQNLKVESRFSLLKTEIDSVDGPVLDSVLRHFQPYVVYSEIAWDFAPPVEFTLVQADGGFGMLQHVEVHGPFTGGCFGMSLSMAHHILQKNGYRLIQAAHANVIAVHEDVAHLFEDRPQDPWFWFQFVKDGSYHSHWMGGGAQGAASRTPLSQYGKGLGLYTEVERTDGHDNFGKPPVGIRSMDMTMSRIAQRVEEGCKLSASSKYMLAVGDRCCAPQWNVSESCVCEFPADKAKYAPRRAA